MSTILDVKDKGLTALLDPAGFSCDCGIHHLAPLNTIFIGPGVIEKLPETAKKLGMKRPALVADQNTWQAAGQAAFDLLAKAGFEPARCVLDTGRPEANERWLGVVVSMYSPGWDGIISVGSGTINDLSKMMAGIAKLPLINLGTAPSMDGFASNSASMLINGVKKSIPAPCPSAILADTTIMAAAPERMLLAGLGDMLAKYVSICEWRIGHVVTGEYYCEAVAGLVRDSLAQCRAAAPALLKRDPDAVAKTASGLILSGIAMSFANVTRPASGVEHYFSHVWEMHAEQAGKTSDLHGIQVGVGLAMALPLYDLLKKETPSREAAEAFWEAFDGAAYRQRIENDLMLAPDVAERHRAWVQDEAPKRLDTILAKWPEIVAIMNEELPGADELLALYHSVGLPATPAELGIGVEETRKTFIETNDFRDKYVLSSLLSDLGLLDRYADALAAMLQAG